MAGTPVFPRYLGYRFQPTDEEMIRILTMKRIGQQIPSLIIERPIYAADASFDFDADFATMDRTLLNGLYYITPLENNHRHYGSSDEDRVVGNGTWKYQGTYDVCHPRDESRAIGVQKMFSFVDSNSRKKGWIMHEFTLLDLKVWAICRIKKIKVKRYAAS